MPAIEPAEQTTTAYDYTGSDVSERVTGYRVIPRHELDRVLAFLKDVEPWRVSTPIPDTPDQGQIEYLVYELAGMIASGYKAHAFFPLLSYPVFDTAGDAFHHVKANDLEQSHRIVFVPAVRAVREMLVRERRRITSNDYDPIPWPADILPWQCLHAVHLSKTTPGSVAFTKTIEAGIADRQTTMRPGRYLQTYGSPDLTPDQIEEFAAMCTASANDLKIAKTADDIERVYVGGPSSCMGGHDAEDFESCCHPVRVYGDSDLAIAYTGPMDRATARAIVWPERQRYGRVYGHESLLVNLLEKAGYSAGDMRGARIRRIWNDEDRNSYVMPYIDGIGAASDMRDGWIRLGSGPIETSNTSGVSEDDPNTAQCDNCRAWYDPDDTDATGDYCPSCAMDLQTCQSCDSEGFDMNQTDGGNTLCDDCYTSQRHDCEVCTHSFDAFDLTRGQRRMREANGTEALCDDCQNFRQCDRCDDWYDADSADRCPDCNPPEDDDDDDDDSANDDTPTAIVRPAPADSARDDQTLDLLDPVRLAFGQRLLTDDTPDDQVFYSFQLVRLESCGTVAVPCYMLNIDRNATIAATSWYGSLSQVRAQKAHLSAEYPEYRYAIVSPAFDTMPDVDSTARYPVNTSVNPATL